MYGIYGGTVLFLGGCYIGLQWVGAGLYSLLLPGLLLAVLLALALRVSSKLLPLVLALGMGLVGLGAGLQAPVPAQLPLAPYWQQQVQVYGSLEPMSVQQREYGSSLVLSCEQLHFQGQSIPYRGRLRVSLQEQVPTAGRLWLEGTLQPLHSLHNPGSLDGSRWNYIHGLGGRLQRATLLQVQEETSLLRQVELLNVRLRQLLLQYVPGERGNLLGNMVLGGSGGLSTEVYESFVNNGLVHLLSVSGSHLVLLTSFLQLCLGRLPLPISRPLISLLLVAYGVLCGLQPPVLRALTMSMVLLWGGRGGAKGRILCLTAVLMLIFKPLWLYEIGFQLSFVTAAGLLWLYPKLKPYCCARLPNILGEALAITLAAQLAALPWTIGYFHQLSLISLLSNMLLVPLLELAMLVTITGLVLVACMPGWNGLLLLASWILQQTLVQSMVLAQLPGAVLTIGTLPLWCGVVYYFILALWVDVPLIQFLRNEERRLALGAGGAVLVITLVIQNLWPQPLTIYFMDVGQGDGAVIITPSKQVLVIDTGGLKNYDTGSRLIVPLLRSLGKSQVDLMVLTHGDYDHLGGAAGIARNLQVEQVLLPLVPTPDKEAPLLQQLDPKRTLRCGEGHCFSFGQVQLQLLPTPQDVAQHGPNYSSYVCLLEYRGQRVLFTGDIDEERERGLQQIGPCQVLKVAHHGSKSSSCQEFLEQVRPSLAIISSGLGNSYGHPHQEVLTRLGNNGAQILRTDHLGAIKLVVEEKGLFWSSYRDNWQ